MTIKYIKRRSWIVTLMVWLTSCSAGNGNIAEMVKARGNPVVVASNYEEVLLKDGVVQVSLFSVTRDLNSTAPSKLTSGTCLVFSGDEAFKSRVRWHFESMQLPHEYTGSTMFASGRIGGTELGIIKVEDDGRGKMVFKKNVAIVYLEVGDKDHLIRQKPKPRPIGNK